MSFDPFGAIGGLVSGAIGALTQHDANKKNYQIQQQTNAQNYSMFQQGQQFNAAQTAEQMAFQERMASSAWQRGVADMRAAGINPILAASAGAASAPSGASASSPSANQVVGNKMESIGSRAIEAFNSALNAKMNLEQLKQVQAQTRKVGSEIDLNRALEKNTRATSALTTAKLPREQVYSDIWSIPKTMLSNIKDKVSDIKKNGYEHGKQGDHFWFKIKHNK